MADNYLERKMEDLRRGKPTVASSRSSSLRKGYVQFPFPPRRIVVADISAEMALPIIREFKKADCKIAFISEDRESGKALAYKEGIRFIEAEADYESFSAAFDSIIKAWREVEIIITSPETARILAKKMAAHLEQLHIPRPYGGRFFTIETMPNFDYLETRFPDIESDDEPHSLYFYMMKDLKKILGPHHFTVNSFFIFDPQSTSPYVLETLSRNLLTLSLPSSYPLSDLFIRL